MGLTYSQFIGATGDASCVFDSDIYQDNYVLPVGGILSTLCYAYLFYLYFVLKLPTLTRHPTTLSIFKCVFEACFVQAFIWTPFVPSKYFYDVDTGGNCLSTPLAAFLSFWSQFFLLGGEIWFAVISMDLQMSYSNPFSSFRHYKNLYIGLILCISLLYSVLLMCFGPKAYGVSSLGVVWIQDRKGQENYIKIVCFYSLMPIIYFYSLFTIMSLSLKMRRGFTETLSIRLSIMTRSRSYIIGYSIFWGIVFSLELASALVYRAGDSNRIALSDNLASAASYCFAFRGVWALGMILGPNWNDLTRSNLLLVDAASPNAKNLETTVQEGLLMKPHLNSALRAEILYFTTQGIMFAASESSKHENSVGGEEAASPAEEDGIRDSQFSFKDILERISLQSDVDGNVPHARDESCGHYISPHGTLSLIREKRIQQSNLLHPSVLREVERDWKDIGGYMDAHGMSASQNNSAGVERRPADKSMQEDIEMPNKLPLPRPSDFIIDSMQAVDVLDNDEEEVFREERYRSQMNRTEYINSPFYDYRTSDSQKSDKSSSQKSDASQKTVKWKDATDAHFRMIHSDPSATAEAPGTGKKVWELNPAGKDGIRITAKSSAAVTSNSVNGISRVESLAGSFVQLFEQARLAATSAVYGTYDEFGFTDYSTKQFAMLRSMSGINTREYIEAFRSTANENFSEGRSGAFMFCSSDHRYIVKTTTLKEMAVLLDLLPRYISFLDANPNSLLVRILGAHCITMYSTKLYFIVMLNVFPKERLSEKYDLKGSWVNRYGNRGDRLTRREKRRDTVSTKSIPLYQDNDIQQKICLKTEVAMELLDQVDKDTRFLASANLMDYSLLIGTVRRNFEVINDLLPSNAYDAPNPAPDARNGLQLQADYAPSVRSSRSAVSQDYRSANNSGAGISLEIFLKDGMDVEVVEAPGTYYIGLIDTLQEWNLAKKVERFYKVYICGLDGAGISAIEPRKYQERFMQRAVRDVFEGLDGI